MRMSSNNVRPITITKGFLVFKFHPQFRQLSFQTLGYFYESRQKVKINPFPLLIGKSCVCSIAYRIPSIKQASTQAWLSFYLMQRIIYAVELHKWPKNWHKCKIKYDLNL